jgi:hypothetical protein
MFGPACVLTHENTENVFIYSDFNFIKKKKK